MTDKQKLIELATQLVQEFQAIEMHIAKTRQEPDGIIQSITSTLNKLLYAVSNNLVLNSDIKHGLDRCCAVAVKTFEGSGIDDELCTIKALADTYQPC